jgi:uroporphyrinogen decarboxylase
MDCRERFITAVNGGKPDRVPIFDFLEGRRIFKEVLEKDIESPSGADITECSIKLGFDAVFIAYGGFYNSESVELGDIYTDEWGVVYKNTGVSWPIDPPYRAAIKDRDDLEKWLKNIPDPWLENRLNDINTALEISNGRIAVIGGVIGPLTLAILTLGFEGMLMKLMDEPDMVEEIFRVSTDFHKVAVEKMASAGADAIFVCEDLGFNDGIFAPPDIYRKYLFPYLSSLIDEIRIKNVPVLLHSCGNVNEVLDDLAGFGISALHPLQRKARMDIESVRKRYGTKLCLIGNIDATDTLAYGSVREIENEVRNTIDIAGKDGAYVLASDSDYHDGIPPKNFIAMVNAARRFGKYPVKF